jgi:hypothetical protein
MKVTIIDSARVDGLRIYEYETVSEHTAYIPAHAVQEIHGWIMSDVIADYDGVPPVKQEYVDQRKRTLVITQTGVHVVEENANALAIDMQEAERKS